jgi:hypothetical protein
VHQSLRSSNGGFNVLSSLMQMKTTKSDGTKHSRSNYNPSLTVYDESGWYIQHILVSTAVLQHSKQEVDAIRSTKVENRKTLNAALLVNLSQTAIISRALSNYTLSICATHVQPQQPLLIHQQTVEMILIRGRMD